jgi:3-methyladenine DNA glycosylase/8-oxoguanine DNA glycosylase
MELSLSAPRDFNFKRTAISHGWYQLLPCGLNRETWTLKSVLDIGEERPPVVVHISGAKGGLRIHLSRRLDGRATEKVTRDVRHMLRLDDDMKEFYAALKDDTEFSWVVREGAGRLLRSPTVFEDLVKTICTTNCSWALTLKMVEGLVRQLGRAASDGSKSFPTAQAMAEVPLSFYRDEVRAGYRAPYLHELASRVADGSLDVEGWLKSALPTTELQREMKRIKGVGDYAAETMLKLIGRYDGLALDSWVRAKFARMHNKGRAASDRKIARHYARFNNWRGLALWCDITRDWA